MKPIFHTTPWKHQKAALKFLYYRSFGALYTDMGSGKTKIMIDLIVNRRFKLTLIVAPKKVCRVWKPEFMKHAPNQSICVIDVSKVAGDRKAGIILETLTEAKFDQIVIVVNYDSVWRHPFKSFLLKLGIDCVICDESHRIKSPSSKCSRALQLIGKRVSNRYLMTGTPLAQNPLDIYAQYRFLAPEIFGTSFQRFKDEFSNQIRMPGGFTILDKKNPYKNLDRLHDLMFSCAFKMDVEESLPPTQDITLSFDMSTIAQKHYLEFKKESCLELDEGVVTAGNILTIITRLQQLTSGYLPVETNEGKAIVEIDDSRILRMRELLEDIAPEEPIVVFCKYRKDIKNIRKLVHEMGWKSSEVSGKRDTLDNWLAGNTKVLVVQISSGAEGIDLTRARYCIYYTLTHSLMQYKQSRKRVHRPGQTRPVIYYKLVAKMGKGKGRTVDELIIKSLDNNQELINTIMEEREV